MPGAAVKTTILFLCVANSARSQMAEGLARQLLGNEADIRSAGSQPGARIRPEAIEVMKEIGIDLSASRPKSHGDLPPEFLAGLDYVITLCAEEVCPVIPSQNTTRLHWPIDDPVGAGNTEEETLTAFRMARDLIKEHLQTFALKRLNASRGL
jgi:arsenate reductase